MKNEDQKSKKDLFKRNVFLEKLKAKIKEVGVEGGAIAVNAEFGMGKTFFAENIIIKNYEDSGEKHHLIDAALNQHVQTPLNTLLCELEAAIHKEYIDKKLDKLKFLKAISLSVPFLNVDIGKIMEAEQFSMKNKVDGFKSELKELITTKTPFTIIVDELDRCNPKFAIEFIECLQHFFKIPGLVFVLMVNYDQIKKDMNHLYGAECDAQKYLEKFFYDSPLELTKDEAYFKALYEAKLATERHRENHLNTENDQIINQNAVNYENIELLSSCSFNMDVNYRQCDMVLETFNMFFSRLKRYNSVGLCIYHIMFIAILCTLDDNFKKKSGEIMLKELKKTLEEFTNNSEKTEKFTKYCFNRLRDINNITEKNLKYTEGILYYIVTGIENISLRSLLKI